MSEDIHVDWNPVMAEQAIYRVSQRIAKGVPVAKKALAEWKAAEHDYEKIYSRRYVSEDLASKPVHERKHWVILDDQVQAARDRMDVAEVAYKFAANMARALESELDALRSINTSVRQAYSTAGVGER